MSNAPAPETPAHISTAVGTRPRRPPGGYPTARPGREDALERV